MILDKRNLQHDSKFFCEMYLSKKIAPTVLDSLDAEKLLISKLIAANEKKIKGDQIERRRNVPRFKDSTESNTVHCILNSILFEPEAMLSFTSNKLVKFTIFDIIIGLIENAKTDQFKRKCLKTLKAFLDKEYDSTNKCFTNTNLISQYGSILFKIIHCISDLAIDESFYCDEDADYSGNQQELLTIVNYVLKTVSLRSIIRIGFKSKHLQFLIIHFTKSYYIPEIILAISENLNESSQLYKKPDGEMNQDKTTMSNEYIDFVTISCYEILIKSINLMIKLYSNSSRTLSTIQKANWYLADYAKKNISVTTVSKKQHMIKMTQFIVKDIVKKLKEESKSKYRSMKYQLLNVYLCVILSHFDNLNEDMKKKHAQPLVFAITKIHNRLAQHEAFRSLTKTELLTRNTCFSIIIKILEISREKFYQNHLEFNGSKTFFEPIWLNAINHYCEMACLAFISFIRSTNIPKFVPFVIRVIVLVDRKIKLDGNEIKDLSLHLRILISIADYFSSNLYKEELKNILKPVLDKAIKKLNEASLLDAYYLNMKFQFVRKIIQVSFTGQTRPTGLYRDMIIDCMKDFQSIASFDVEFKIEENIYLECLELLRLIIKFFRPESIIKMYRPILVEILYQVEINLNMESTFYTDDKCEVERMLKFLEEN